MRTLVLPLSLIVALTVFIGAAAPAKADSFIQLSLWNPIQIVNAEKSVGGIRLNLIYGQNANMTGFDLGLANVTTGKETGIMWGAYNRTNECVGWQAAIANFNYGDFTGFQWAFVNKAQTGTSKGVSVGAINSTARMSGLQLGIVNYTQEAYGLQIGLVNIIKSKSSLSFFPIVNWKF